jgi:hypothetical protein
MIKYKPLPPLELLQELFELDESSRLIYKKRDGAHSRQKPGSEAGYLHPHGYRMVCVNGSNYFTHRIIWSLRHGHDPGNFQVDHINGDRADNRPSNLRLCTPAQNRLNTKLRPNNKSGIRGVYFEPGRGKRRWCASYKNKKLGRFATKEEAAMAVAAAVQACEDREFYRMAS